MQFLEGVYKIKIYNYAGKRMREVGFLGEASILKAFLLLLLKSLSRSGSMRLVCRLSVDDGYPSGCTSALPRGTEISEIIGVYSLFVGYCECLE